jgi:hypothetical protein
MRTLAVVGCVLGGVAAARAAPPPPAGPVLRLGLADPLSVASSAFPGLSNEVDRILGAGGIRVLWTPGHGHSVLVKEGFLVILLPRAPVWGQDKTLGAVAGGVDPGGAAWVFWEPTVAALHLDPNLRKTWSAAEKAMVSRALGRIAAHEIVHLLLPMFPHGQGLMGRRLTYANLIDDSLGLDETITAALHALGDTKLELGFRDIRHPPEMAALEQLTE